MESHRGFVEDLAIIFCVAAFTTVLCRKLKQPVVLGYLVAGLIVGPSIPIPLFADMDRIHALSELGVILVMFAIGLEFSFRKLVPLASTSGIIALLQIALMIWLGYLFGQFFGWTTLESLYAGSMIAISSTMIIAKAFSENRVSRKVSELVVGVLIFEDLVAVLLLAFLTAFSSAGPAIGRFLPITAIQLIAFLLALILLGFFIVPRTIRSISRLNHAETLLVASVGICFAFALIAQRVGYSVALGAFLAGALVAESGLERQIEHLLQPIRDLFAAVFFISVGMLLDPGVMVQHWKPIVALSVVVVVGKILSVSIGAFLTGNDVKTSVQSGMSMAQIGEFSFIIVSAGLALGAIQNFLYPVAIAVSVITTFITPYLIKNASRIADFVDRNLPAPVGTFVTLYGSWMDRLRKRELVSTNTRKLLLLLVADTICLIAIIVGVALGIAELSEMVHKLTGLDLFFSNAVVVVAAAFLIVPFVFGTVRLARGLGLELGYKALPEAEQNKVDFAEAPRTLMVLTMQYGIIVLVSIVVFSITQPFLPVATTTIFLLVLCIAIILMFWQRATNLQGHVRAGGEMILEILEKQSAPAIRQHEIIDQIEKILPGLGKVRSLTLQNSDPSIGKTLSELNIHAITSATIIAIQPAEDAGIVVPSGNVRLSSGDTLALIGTEEAVLAAVELLTNREEDNSF